jgi:drug/metabolite transporter (DMT)-like permease
MIGVVLALLSAMSAGLSLILVRKNLDKSNFIYISLTITIIGNIILWPLALALTDLSTVNPEGLLFFVFAGLLAPGIARLFYYKGMETAGISANATIYATYPLYTSIVAILLLGEALTTENWVGLVCIIAGVISVGRIVNNGENGSRNATKKGLIVPIVGSLAFAFSYIVRKEALNIYNQPLLGVSVGYTTSLFVYLLAMAFSKNAGTSGFSRNDIKMFWKPGVGMAMAWVLSFFALSQEMVSIVAPVLQTELLFILFFTYIFLRKIEKLSPKLVVSSLLIVAGVILISIN